MGGGGSNGRLDLKLCLFNKTNSIAVDGCNVDFHSWQFLVQWAVTHIIPLVITDIYVL